MEWQGIATNTGLGLIAFLGGLAYNNVNDTTKENKDSIKKIEIQQVVDYKKTDERSDKIEIQVKENEVLLRSIHEKQEEAKEERKLMFETLQNINATQQTIRANQRIILDKLND